jgi:hypothetical protein
VVAPRRNACKHLLTDTDTLCKTGSAAHAVNSRCIMSLMQCDAALCTAQAVVKEPVACFMFSKLC